jgi:hypothetical protein
MPDQRGSCPLSQREQIEAYFMESRNRVLELAAFLDRLDRAPSADAADDFRLVALREALSALCHEGGRMQRVQMIFSDQNCELLAELDQKSAFGAAKPRS